MMRIRSNSMLFLSLTLAAGQAAAITCPADSVPVGTVCVDKYEASVWAVPTTGNKTLVSKLRKGTATLGDLLEGGATQLGCVRAPFNHAPFPASFPANGHWTPVPGSDPPTPGVYAASVPGVLPSTCITWFQSAQACRLLDKRLLTNAEWQDAAAGTPDPGNADDGSTTCVTLSQFGPDDTGSRTSCKSNWGASDMVGNVAEWVADWVPQPTTACPGWGGFSDDAMCLAGASETTGPGALIRGGDSDSGAYSGVFRIEGYTPVDESHERGFRCAR